MMQAYTDKKCTDMEQIAVIAESTLPNGEQIARFLRHKITEPNGKHAIPLFYGIPKIHKQPVKMRPIIPCHSAVQNPAAKYVSKILKPIIKSAPTVIHGSKDLAIKLSKIKLDYGRRFFIVTGDVVAFYPSIPIEKCLDIVTEMYLEYFWEGNTPTTTQGKHEATIFIKCLLAGNRDLITRYGDKYYLQKRGLAMGVADSPDLANLYGWKFERECKITDHPLIPFYGRYIDDCLAIVYASSKTEALHHLAAVKFDDCEIEWDASDQFQHFLDMTLYRDELGKLQHMPYRKAQSHQERIPWISHHPLDVKRGTFIGEMSRLATLSSLNSHYVEAVKGLVALYIKRGYPQNVVLEWLKNNIKERWNKRLNEDRPAPNEVLVLKSEFNTAWNYFSATELGNTVLGYWRDWINRAESNNYNVIFPRFSGDSADLDSTPEELMLTVTESSGEEFFVPDIRKIGILNRRMIVSRKRTRNLFDLTSLWKKTVLTHLDEDALDPQPVEEVLEPIEPIDIAMNPPGSPGSDDSEREDQGYLFRVIGYR